MIFRGCYSDSRVTRSLSGEEALTGTGLGVVEHWENGFGEGPYVGHAFWREVSDMFKQRPLRCSFCGKQEAEISKLVAGPRVYICDECVALASRIMEGDSSADTQLPGGEWSVWRRLLTRARRLLRGGDTRRVRSVVVSGQEL